MFLTLKATAAGKGANESKSEGGVDLEKKGQKVIVNRRKWDFLRRCICEEGRSKCVMEGIVKC